MHTVLRLTKYNGKPTQGRGGEGPIPSHKGQWEALRRALGKEEGNQRCQAFTRALPALLGMLARRCTNCSSNSETPAAFFVIKHLLKCVSASLLS